jgi:hypothetical protein
MYIKVLYILYDEKLRWAMVFVVILIHIWLRTISIDNANIEKVQITQKKIFSYQHSCVRVLVFYDLLIFESSSVVSLHSSMPVMTKGTY